MHDAAIPGVAHEVGSSNHFVFQPIGANDGIAGGDLLVRAEDPMIYGFGQLAAALALAVERSPLNLGDRLDGLLRQLLAAIGAAGSGRNAPKDGDCLAEGWGIHASASNLRIATGSFRARARA